MSDLEVVLDMRTIDPPYGVSEYRITNAIRDWILTLLCEGEPDKPSTEVTITFESVSFFSYNIYPGPAHLLQLHPEAMQPEILYELKKSVMSEKAMSHMQAWNSLGDQKYRHYAIHLGRRGDQLYILAKKASSIIIEVAHLGSE